MDPMARHSERNSLASHAMSASAQNGASGKRRISVKDGANSCACPGVSTKSTNRPAASHTPTILVPRPPRERPSASSRLAANVSQIQPGPLPGRAPDAFWCARGIVPSTQANASCGSPAATSTSIP